MGNESTAFPPRKTLPPPPNPGMKAREDKGRLLKKPSIFWEGRAFSLIFPSA